jgi:hypothetical protein
MTKRTPLPSAAARRTVAKRKAAFIEALAELGRVDLACKRSGLPRSTLYKQRKVDAKFAKAVDAAVDESVILLEDEAHRRAVKGTKKPVYYLGQKIGEIAEYSDTLLIFLLKARRPDVYRERWTGELTGADGAPLQPAVIYLPDNGRGDRNLG